jgi:hypothetical protein
MSNLFEWVPLPKGQTMRKIVAKQARGHRTSITQLQNDAKLFNSFPGEGREKYF